MAKSDKAAIWTVFLVSVLFVSVSSAIGAHADEYVPTDKEKSIIDDFGKANGEMLRALNTPVGCESYSALSGKTTACDFAALCKFFDKNKDRASIYKNARGESIPNFQRFDEENQLKACYRQALRKEHKFKTDQEAFIKYEAKVGKHRAEVFGAYEAYTNALAQADPKDAQTMVILGQVQRRKIIEDAEKAQKAGVEPAAPPRTRPDFEKLLSAQEVQIKRKISPKVRSLYLDYLVKDAEPEEAFSLPTPPELELLTSDPDLNVSLLVDEGAAGSAAKVLANQEDYKKKIERGAKIFKDTQDSIVSLLTARSNAKNKLAIDSMISRIRSIHFKPAALPVAADCDSPNAYYSGINHSFTMCPQLMAGPESYIRAVMAHELGHAIDPCTVTSPLLAVNGEKVVPPPHGKLPDQIHPFKPPEYNKDPNTDYVVDFFGAPDLTLREQYKSYSTLTSAEPVSRIANPFDSVLGCLKSPQSMGARETSEAELGKSLDARIKTLEAAGMTDDTSSDLKSLRNTRKNLHALMKDKSACSYLSGKSKRSQMQESFADWVSGKVTEQTISNAPAENQKDIAFESLGFFEATGCRASLSLELRNPRLAELQKKYGCDQSAPAGSTGESLDAIGDATAREYNEHPSTPDRVNRIFLANPGIKKAMGCASKKGIKSCE